MQKTSIEWVATYHADGTVTPGYTSNPIYAVNKETGKRGWFCTKISTGCAHCYSEAMNKRWGNKLAYSKSNEDKIEFVLNEKELALYNKPGATDQIFVGDMIDLFHHGISDDMICKVFETMLDSDYIFKVLTKRADRQRVLIDHFLNGLTDRILENIWLGVSVENQDQDWRIDELANTRAMIRFISYEPALGPLKLPRYPNKLTHPIHQVIAGAESGAGARPMQEEWVRDMKEQCKELGISFFYKQNADHRGRKLRLPVLDGQQYTEYPVLARN